MEEHTTPVTLGPAEGFLVAIEDMDRPVERVPV